MAFELEYLSLHFSGTYIAFHINLTLYVLA